MKQKGSVGSPMNIGRHQSHPAMRCLGVIAGALLASSGLELFLMPHGIVVGGMTGLSALFAFKTEMRLGLFLFLFNVPFLLLQRKKIDFPFGIFTVLGLLVFSLGTVMLHPYPPLTDEQLSAALLGGLSLGMGIGLALRFGGALDTAEQAAEFMRLGIISPEWIILIFNCTILIAAGFHFGFDQAVYSVIAYILAFEAVKIPVQGFRFTYTVLIQSRNYREIQADLQRYLNLRAAFRTFPAENGEEHGILECECNRLELFRLRAIVRDHDADGKITFRF